jgi:ParB-like chromosome segregation protein Spo0J
MPKLKQKATPTLSATLPLTIEQRPLEHLRPSPTNAKLHSDVQLHALARSIQANGFVNPILADPKGEIIAGHGRYEAALRLG